MFRFIKELKLINKKNKFKGFKRLLNEFSNENMKK